MTAALAHNLTSPAAFLAFIEDREDHERWELIDGEAVMQASPTLTHALIAGDIDRLLNEAFTRNGSSLVALQNAMADLNTVSRGNMYVPDVMVLEGTGIGPNQNTTSELVAAIEVLSPGELRKTGELARTSQAKLDCYRLLPSCSVIMLVTQHEAGLRLFRRSGAGVDWSAERIFDLDAEIVIDELGLRCRLRDFYWRTFLARTQA